MAAGSGSLSSSPSDREQTDFGAEHAAIQEALGDNPLAGRVEHLQGLFDGGVLPVIEAYQRTQLAEAQAKFDDDDLEGALEILADRAFEVQTDVDVATLGAEVAAAQAAIAEQAERDAAAGGHLFDADKALDSNNFAEAKGALEKAIASHPQGNALAQYDDLSAQYHEKVAEAKGQINTAITSCAPEAASDLEGALSLVTSLQHIEVLTDKEARAYTKVLNALKGLKEGTGDSEDHLDTLEVQAVRLKSLKTEILATRQRFEEYKPAEDDSAPAAAAGPKTEAAAAAGPKTEAAAGAARSPSPEQHPMKVEGDFTRLARQDKAGYVTQMLAYFQDEQNNDIVLLEKLFRQFTEQGFTSIDDQAKLSVLLGERRAKAEANIRQFLKHGQLKEATALIDQMRGVNPQFAAALRKQISSFTIDDEGLEDRVAYVRKSGGMTPASAGLTTSGGLDAAIAHVPLPSADGAPVAGGLDVTAAASPSAPAAPEVDVPALENSIDNAIRRGELRRAELMLKKLAKTSSTKVAMLTEALTAAQLKREIERLEKEVLNAIAAVELNDAERLLGELAQTSSKNVEALRGMFAAAREEDQESHVRLFRARSESRVERDLADPDFTVKRGAGSSSSSSASGSGDEDREPKYVGSVYDMQDEMAETRAQADGPDPAAAAAPKADAPPTPASADAAPKRALPTPKARPKAKGAAQPKGAPKKAAGSGPKVPTAAASAVPVDGAVDFNAELSALKGELSKPMGPALIRSLDSITERLEALKAQVGSDDAKKAALNAVIQTRNAKFAMSFPVQKVS